MQFSFDPALCRAGDKSAIYFKHRDVMNVYVEPHEMMSCRARAELEKLLLHKIENSFQGRCTQEGYVVPSHRRLCPTSQQRCKIRMITRADGFAAGEHFNGSWVYKINFEYLVCNPTINTCVHAVVVGVNKFGMMCQLWPYERKGEHFHEEEGQSYLKAAYLPHSRANYMVILLPKQLQYGARSRTMYETVQRGFAKHNNTESDGGAHGALLPLICVRIMRSRFEVAPFGGVSGAQNGKQINAIGVIEDEHAASDSDEATESDLSEDDGDESKGNEPQSPAHVGGGGGKSLSSLATSVPQDENDFSDDEEEAAAAAAAAAAAFNEDDDEFERDEASDKEDDENVKDSEDDQGDDADDDEDDGDEDDGDGDDVVVDDEVDVDAPSSEIDEDDDVLVDSEEENGDVVDAESDADDIDPSE